MKERKKKEKKLCHIYIILYIILFNYINKIIIIIIG